MRRTSPHLPILAAALLLGGCADHPLPTAVAPQGAALEAAAGDYVVTTTADDGPGSLRAAVAAAHAAGGAKTITFAIPGCSASACTIQLASVLQITKPEGLTIDGTGQRVRISGTPSSLFWNQQAAVLTLKYLTLTNARVAISNDYLATLTISHSTFSGNSSGLEGGAIDNFGGTLVISHTTFESNTAHEKGGAIHNHGGNASITHSTFVSNAVLYDLEFINSGGAIYNRYGDLRISHSTFSGNSSPDAGGAIFSQGGTVAVSFSTFSGNSAGAVSWDVGSEVGIKNSIIANSASGANCVFSAPVAGVNFSTDGSCTGFTQVTSAQLALGSLANNGGATQTHALGTGSVAIDAVTDCTEWDGTPATTDQRGVSRPQGVRCDAGAFELEQTPPPDNTPPTINCSVPDATVWYGQNVTVPCTASDSGSGLADPADASFSLSTNVAVGVETNSASTGSRQVCDNAGNCATAGPYTFRVDRKAPIVTCSAAPVFLLNQAGATVSATVTDGGSGPASPTASTPVGTTAVGSFTADVAGEDQVGNSTSASCGYRVEYAFEGFLAPIHNGVVNVARAGQTIPLKWRLTDAQGNPVTTLGSVQVSFESVPCGGGDPSSPIGGDSPGGSGLQNLGDGNFQFNWQTNRNLANRCGIMHLNLGEGSTRTTQFQFIR